MTVIAAKPNAIAADSQETGNAKRHCRKLFTPAGRDYVVGMAGCATSGAVLTHCVEWPEEVGDVRLWTMWAHQCNAALGDSFNMEEVHFLAVGPEFPGVLRFESGYVTIVKGSTAVGSGAEFAIGFLESNPSDIITAVEVAIKHDPYCGGTISYRCLSQKSTT